MVSLLGSSGCLPRRDLCLLYSECTDSESSVPAQQKAGKTKRDLEHEHQQASHTAPCSFRRDKLCYTQCNTLRDQSDPREMN